MTNKTSQPDDYFGSEYLSTLESPPMIRAMALHALAYCERLFYLEEVEGIYVQNSKVFEGRELHEDLESGEEIENLTLESEKIGLMGRVDAIRRRDGKTIVYEHKKGHSRSGEAWESDQLQVGAYCLLLETAAGRTIEEARIRYHADKQLVHVPWGMLSRLNVERALERARELQKLDSRPPVTIHENRCTHCSLAPVCLPAENRIANSTPNSDLNAPQEESRHENSMPKSLANIPRMFPPDRDRKSLHILQHGDRIGRSGDRLKLTRTGDNSTESNVPATTSYPIEKIGEIVLHGNCQISTQAIHFCAENGVGLHWISVTGRYIAGLNTGAGRVQRLHRQYKALSGSNADTFRFGLARRIIQAKVTDQIRYVLRASRGAESSELRNNILSYIREMRSSLRSIPKAETPDTLRGYEGIAGCSYWSAMKYMIGSRAVASLHFETRNRRPPRDRFNCLLGFGYALLLRSVHQSILTVGLEPSIGIFHTARSTAPPLALDLMELFRVSTWDIPLLASVNRGQWNDPDLFVETPIQVWLSEQGRRQAISLYETRLAEQWTHPVLKYSLSYARLMELEVRLLEKEWTDNGVHLFARNRLR